MHSFWVLVHLLGAALWLGGLVFLGVLVGVGYSRLPREQFQATAKLAGRSFAGISVLAWVLLGASGLALAGELRWPQLVVEKAVLGGLLVVTAVAHTLAGARTGNRALIMFSRTLSVLILAVSLLVFYLGVRVAEG